MRAPVKKRRCRSCHRTKALVAYPTPLARSCSKCHDGNACVVCGARCGRRRTCGGECLTEWRRRNARRSAARRRRRPRPKHRRCPVCERLKPTTIEHWYVARRDPETGEVARYDSACKACKRAYQRDKYRTEPGRREDALRRAEAQRDADRRRREADPEYAARRRAQLRAYNAASRERRRRPPPRPKNHLGGPRLPGLPLAEAVGRIVDRRRAAANGDWDPEASPAAICRDLGLTERALYAWRIGERRVESAKADEVLTRAGLLWFDVWPPDEYPEVAACLGAA